MARKIKKRASPRADEWIEMVRVAEHAYNRPVTFPEIGEIAAERGKSTKEVHRTCNFVRTQMVEDGFIFKCGKARCTVSGRYLLRYSTIKVPTTPPGGDMVERAEYLANNIPELTAAKLAWLLQLSSGRASRLFKAIRRRKDTHESKKEKPAGR